MIEIELRGIDGGPYPVESHPLELDFPQRDRGRSSATVVNVHHENLVAPILRQLHRRNASATYAELYKAKGEVEAAFPRRDDGRRILELLLSWCDPNSRNGFPDGTWYVAGAERVPNTRFIALPTEPRLSERSLAGDAIDALAGHAVIGEADRMDDIEGYSLEPLERQDISIVEAMRHPRSNPDDKSSSSSGGGRKRTKPLKGIVGVPYAFDDGPGARKQTAVVAARVEVELKTALDSDPKGKREMLEACALAILSGATYAKVIASIQDLDQSAAG
jgi:hypothetical protein